jgi:hypothetical protein
MMRPINWQRLRLSITPLRTSSGTQRNQSWRVYSGNETYTHIVGRKTPPQLGCLRNPVIEPQKTCQQADVAHCCFAPKMHRVVHGNSPSLNQP